jgi:Tol biopolymer transport system component
VASDGTEADDQSLAPAISTDGRYVAFESDATNLVSGDNNTQRDIFVHDRETGSTERVSLDSSGNEVNTYGSENPDISGDGRYVVFQSQDSGFVSGATATYVDIFLRDRTNGTTTWLSANKDGTDANGSSTDPAISADGTAVAFVSSASDLIASDGGSTKDVFVRDLGSNTTERVSVDTTGGDPDDDSGNTTFDYPLDISADGRYVAFDSQASNLVSGDTNPYTDIFVYDRQGSSTLRVNVAADGSETTNTSIEAAISGNGAYAAFTSSATNLIDDDSLTKDVYVAPVE